MRRRHWTRTDDQLRNDPAVTGLLEAIRDGRLTRATEGGFWATYLLDGEPVDSWRLRVLQRDDLIDMPMGGPPRLAPRGCLVLDARKRPTQPGG